MNAALFDRQTSNAGPKVFRYRYIVATFVVYVPLAVCGFLWGVRFGTFEKTPLGVLAMVALGAFAWTLLEYLLHRFVHTLAQMPVIGMVIGRLHLKHHQNPADEAKVTTPVYGSLPIAVVCLGLLRLAGASWETSLTVMTGILSGYLFYEAVHFRIHSSATRGRVVALLRVAHIIHHRDQLRHFGVTTPLWDWIFRTGGGSK